MRQGCFPAPASFNIFLDHVLRVALNEGEGGVKIKSTLDGEIRVRTRAEAEEIDESILSLLYADDMAIISEEDPRCLEKIVVKLDEVMSQWGLEVSPEKTEISVNQNLRTNPPNITLRGQKLENVEKFEYLGTYFTARPMAKTVTNQKETKQKSRKKPNKHRKQVF